MPNWKKVLTSGSAGELLSLNAPSITGSLLGTASFAVTASYYSGSISNAIFAQTASFVTASNVYGPYGSNSIVSASYATQALSSSYAETSNSSSYALTASYSQNLQISGSINNVDYIDFNTGSAEPTWKSGRVFWNNTDGAISVYNAEADISLQVGQESWVRAWNDTGVLIANGAAVKLVGSHGDAPKMILAQAIQVSGSVTRDNQILGIATHDIEINSFGYITTQGLVKGLNTNAFNDGDRLYVSSSAGQLTNIPLVAPYELIPAGIVVKAGPGTSGIIYADPYQPIDFSDLSSVEDGDYAYGDILTYIKSGSVGVWKHTNQLSGSYGLTGSLTITGSTSTDLVRITQTGTGNAFVVEDSTNPDTSPFVIDATGNVGIGTTSPTAKLHISGNIFTEIRSDGNFITLQATSQRVHYIKRFGQRLQFISDSPNTYDVQFDSSNGSVYFQSGSVGIGTTTPTQRLQIIPSSSGTIGALNLSGSALLIGTINSGLGIDSNEIATSGSSLTISTIDSNPIGLRTNGIQRLTILEAGNVGIGTTTPNAKLDVNGNAIITGSLTVTNGITGSLFGTASWAQNAITASYVTPLTQSVFISGSLVVTGSININESSSYKQDGQNVIYIAKGSDSYYANTVAGANAGTIGLTRQTAYGYLAGTGSIGAYQTSIGYQSGYLNSGPAQTAVGYQAGYLNTSNNQTAVGTIAGQYNSGSQQTAIGYAAGQYNSGSSQTAVGQNAGTLNSGSNQTAIGTNAGYKNSTFSQTAIGANAGIENEGSNQTAVGVNTGYLNNGNNQTALGVQAGQYNSGSSQTAVGYLAGYSNSGSNQVALGQNAGRENTGSNNTNIGHNAGYFTTGATVNTGSSFSVFLGSSTQAGDGNRTNQIVIGYNAIGIGSNSVVLGNNSITTTALKGFVGIGITTPTASLHITNTSTSASFLVEDSTNPDTTPFVIDTLGSVGIGTLTPNAKLDVNGNTIITGSLTAKGTGTTGVVLDTDTNADFQSTRLFFKMSGSGNDVSMRNVSGSLLVVTKATAGVSSGTTTAMFISSSGNVAIGNTQPTLGNLQVQGNVYATSYTGSLFGTASYALSSSYAVTASYYAETDPVFVAKSGSFATTGSNTFKASQTITGSLTITNDLIVLGSSSIQYVTSSQLNISTNIINVNTNTPAVRFGGLAVNDSGSSPIRSGSILFDSRENQWLFVHQDGSGVVTSSLFIMGPETYNSIGSETYPTTNRILKSLNAEHIGDSNITDNGTTVSINSNTEITGSLNVSSITASAFITNHALITSTTLTANAGITTIYSIPTASYDGAWFDYTIRSGSNARAGTIFGLWSGSAVNYAETTTTDFGSTANFTFGMSINGSNMILSGSTTTNGWTVNSIIRSI